jgi:hypothetical protein
MREMPDPPNAYEITTEKPRLTCKKSRRIRHLWLLLYQGILRFMMVKEGQGRRSEAAVVLDASPDPALSRIFR